MRLTHKLTERHPFIAWWHIGYLFVVLFLYGLASVLWAYMISLFAKSQLAAFAIAAGTQA